MKLFFFYQTCRLASPCCFTLFYCNIMEFSMQSVDKGPFTKVVRQKIEYSGPLLPLSGIVRIQGSPPPRISIYIMLKLFKRLYLENYKLFVNWPFLVEENIQRTEQVMFSSLLFTPLHSSSLLFTPLHSSSLLFTPLHSSSLLFTPLLRSQTL